jgi:hypothetical protein
MSTSEPNPSPSSDEQKFIQRAMADIDKAEKVQKIKQIVILGSLYGGLVFWAIRTPGPEVNNFFVILVVAIGIARISFRINSSTRTILRAILNRQ